MTRFEPESVTSRQELAGQLMGKFFECGFRVEDRGGFTKEALYSRSVDGTDGKIRVIVYTTIVQGATTPLVRGCGKDAIRVCSVYRRKDGKERGISREIRVNRTGEIEKIVTRVHERMRDAYREARTGAKCECGAPKFLSKKGNLVCAELCFMAVGGAR